MESLLRYRPESLEALTEDGRTAWKVRWRDIRWIARRGSTTRIRARDGRIHDCPEVDPYVSVPMFVSWLGRHADRRFRFPKTTRGRTVFWDASHEDALDLPRLARKHVRAWNEIEPPADRPSIEETERDGEARDRHAPPAEVVVDASHLVWKRTIRRAKHFMPDIAARANPVVRGDRVILTVGAPGSVIALDRRTGRTLWRDGIGGLAGPGPILVGARLLTFSRNRLQALDTKRGRTHWTFQVPSPEGSVCDPAVSGDDIFIGDNDGWLHVVDLRSGRPRGSRRLGSGNLRRIISRPHVTEDRVYAATVGGAVFALDRFTGEMVWRARIPKHAGGAVVPWNGGVVVSTLATVCHLDHRTGHERERWSFPGRRVLAVDATPHALVIAHERNPFQRAGQNPEPMYVALGPRGGRWEAPAHGWFRTFLYSPATGLLHESHMQGATLIDPRKGRRLIDVKLDDIHLGPTPTVTRDRIYLATSNAEGVRLLCFRRPR